MTASNAPKDYVCPICLGVSRQESKETLIRPTDIVYSDNLVTVFINSFFIGNNPGHAIVVPNTHIENIYDLPTDIGHRVMDITRSIAVAMKSAYKCDGITIRQNNEPAGDQHAFHFHLHVFPRYKNDGFNAVTPEEKRPADAKERMTYAVKLSQALERNNVTNAH